MFPHRKKFIGIFFILLTALGLSACAALIEPEPTSTPTATLTPEPPTATPEPLALPVNGEGVSSAECGTEVARYTTAQEALGKTVSSADTTSAVIEDLTAQLLLAQGAQANGFNLDSAALQTRVDSL